MWHTFQRGLNASGALLDGVHGLSDSNKRLLVQLGATGEVARAASFRDVAKKMTTVVSAASRLKTLSVSTQATSISDNRNPELNPHTTSINSRRSTPEDEPGPTDTVSTLISTQLDSNELAAVCQVTCGNCKTTQLLNMNFTTWQKLA
ncbi:hypothetical protein BG011_001303 [Mortierella polycephala]|uniref:Uncharacterized protein n=1 Tax=Mortierella polycephala TaxID=41804 RepID=A0A9P6PKB8_9FUNG|nr:hypothetical protein BG011_001303 [Mortierella polycephala]